MLIAAARLGTNDLEETIAWWKGENVQVWGVVPERVGIAAGPEARLYREGLRVRRRSAPRAAQALTQTRAATLRGRVGALMTATLPELHLADWRATKDTLHLYAQIVGKIRLATTSPRNHWWNAPLYVDVRGLTTRRLHNRGITFDIALDFIDHAVVVRTANGRLVSFELGDGLPVAEFDARLHGLLSELGVDVEIREEPFGVPMTTAFPQDVDHASWDREAIERFGRILDWSDSVFEEFSGWFNGKTSPVHLFWHSLDLAVTRFSGRTGTTSAGDLVNREAYSHELISFGFWAGDDTVGDAAYYSYTAPEPEGLRGEPLAAGRWIEFGAGSLALLPYETVRRAHDPRATLLAFCQSAYEAGARRAGWDLAAFESTWCPTPGRLRQLLVTQAELASADME